MAVLSEGRFPNSADVGSLQRCRALLEDVGYTEERIAAALHVPETPGARECQRKLPLFLERTRGQSRLDTLIRLFVLQQPVPRVAARSAMAPTRLEDWESLGLLELTERWVQAAVALSAWRGLWTAADWPQARNRDAVMGIAGSTRALARLLIGRPAQKTLDLGCGGGVLSLLAARTSGAVTGVDINPRSVSFAGFSATLNAVENVRFVVGDWFEAVRGATFDHIVCNPPFVIGPGDGPLHSHAGRLPAGNGSRDASRPIQGAARPSGDELCRDIVRAAPSYLRPGGYCQILCNWACLKGRAWPDRLAEWISGTGCDAWVLHARTEAASEYAFGRLQELEESSAGVARRFPEWLDAYERAGIEAIGFGMLVLRRSERGRVWFRCTDLHEAAPADGAALERGFAVRDFLEEHADDRRLLDARLRVVPEVVWETQHEPKNSDWSEIRSFLRLRGGFAASAAAEGDVVAFLVQCSGDRRLGDLLDQAAKTAGQAPAGFTPGFLRTVRQLVELGFIEPAPASRATRS